MIEVFNKGIHLDTVKFEDKVANIKGWYDISNYNKQDLGLSLTNAIKGCQIALDTESKASLLFTIGYKDSDFYVIVLDLEKNLKTTYLLKTGADSVLVETEKFNPKIPFFYGKANLDPIPKEDLYKTFFNHLKLGVGQLGWRARFGNKKKWGYITN